MTSHTRDKQQQSAATACPVRILELVQFESRMGDLEFCPSTAAARGLLTMELRARSQDILCGICGAQSGTDTFFAECFSFPLSVSFHQRSTLIHSSACCSYQKDKRAKSGNSQRKQCCFRNRGASDSKMLLSLNLLELHLLLHSLMGSV
jgi:hypothetical protein